MKEIKVFLLEFFEFFKLYIELFHVFLHNIITYTCILLNQLMSETL